MIFSFLQLQCDPIPGDVPTLFNIEAPDMRAAVDAVASEHGWTVSEVDGEFAWYAVGNRDVHYWVTEAK